jgi:hypothetical protein
MIELSRTDSSDNLIGEVHDASVVSGSDVPRLRKKEGLGRRQLAAMIHKTFMLKVPNPRCARSEDAPPTHTYVCADAPTSNSFARSTYFRTGTSW